MTSVTAWILISLVAVGAEGVSGQQAATPIRSPLLWTQASDTVDVALYRPRPRTAQDPAGGLTWQRGLLFGAVGGAALGVLAHLAINSVPCDTCEGGSSSAEGTFPEFVLGFSVGGALIGALIGAVF